MARARPYSRSETLGAASKARSKRRWKVAVACYREVLEHQPDDADVHAKLAPLLVKVGERTQAWRSFEAAAESYRKRGFEKRAAAVYASAISELPEHVDGWERLAVLQVAMGLRRDAVETLLRGSAQFRAKRTLEIAVRMLTNAFEIEPWDFDVSMALADGLRRSGDKAHAKQILEELVERAVGKSRRKVRKLLFKTSATPTNAWRWLVA